MMSSLFYHAALLLSAPGFISANGESSRRIRLASESQRRNEQKNLAHSLLSHRTLQDTIVTVLIRFDGNPQDITWNIKDELGSTVIDSGAGYGPEWANSEFTQQVYLTQASTYQFTVDDSYGDGLNLGLYAIFFGTDIMDPDNLLVFSDEFDSKQESTRFSVQRQPTPAPTQLAPTISPQPTHAPSSCVVDGLAGPKTTNYNPKPDIKVAEDVFVTTNAFCTSHSNYIDCTNENREDCQWIFLVSSHSKGLCRIDPVSKCLQTGDCVCHTDDFHGGPATMAGGILFHAPISVTPRDISKYADRLTYQEIYSTPLNNDKSNHPHDDNFFISKVDFTSRRIIYRFTTESPLYRGGNGHTFAFKLHFLYMDIPLVGTIFNGLGMHVTIDTSQAKHSISINGHDYLLTEPVKIWTCTSVLITPNILYVAGNAIPRNLEEETPIINDRKLTLGSFSGELFDVRIYTGTPSETEVREVGARCTNPDDPAALKVTRDINTLFGRLGCDPMIDRYVIEPTVGGQTYGSGPFSTLWVTAQEDTFMNDGILYDVSEDLLDLEYYFQHQKFQAYIFEKFYFEQDMIGFQLEPYRHFNSTDEIPEFAFPVWNNPCKYMHQNNNLWDFPLYATGIIPKWSAEKNGATLNETFDLRNLFMKGGFGGYQYVAHEMFHEFQQTMFTSYGTGGSRWSDESSASFAPVTTFPGTNVLFHALPLAISYPMGYDPLPESASVNPHFHSAELSFSDEIRIGHLYNSWVLWWFLSEHARLPFLLGQMYTNEKYVAGGKNGWLSMVRVFVEAQGMDFGDVWGVFVAHYRTWDFKQEKLWADAEQADFNALMSNVGINLPEGTTLESRKTTASINSSSGTNGQWVSGPSALRPGPFGWNCLTLAGVLSDKIVVIDMAWGDGMGFQPNTNPPTLPSQQEGCDEDPRFYNNMVVAHNPLTGERRYWKLKGKTPETLVINTGSSGPVDIYILMIPTPPTDYANGLQVLLNTPMYPIPIYNYQYKVEVRNDIPNSVVLAPQEPKMYGIVNFAPATEGYWPTRCTCIDDPSNEQVCIKPIFPKRTPTTTQTDTSPTPYPTVPPSIRPTATRRPTPSPVTASPVTPAPITGAPTTASPVTEAPATRKPTSSSPVTPKPVTGTPTSASPVTGAPMTGKPITAPPVILATITGAPATSSQVTSNLDTCDDERDTNFFVSSIQEFQKCVWLAARPEEQAVLCVDGHEAGAFKICAETCKRCVDTCEDSTGKFSIDGVRRDCSWLNLRSSMQDLFCIPGTEPFTLCKETCGQCDIGSPTTPAPVPAPTTIAVCDDDNAASFFVASLGETQQCVWLAARPEEQIVLCAQEHESRAFHICAETCGKCADNCDDTLDKFDYEGRRDCEWLSLRPSVQEKVCIPGHDAYTTCPETCGGCDWMFSP